MLRFLARSAKLSILQSLKTLAKIEPVRKSLSTSAATQFKENLPHLPVPNLRDTLKKYLKSVIPLLTEAEYEETQKIVEEFGKEDGVGQKLQTMLLEKAKNSENWLETWWVNTMYLGQRLPVVVYSNPGLVFPFQTFKTTRDYLRYVTRLIVATMEYKFEIDNDKIPLEKMGKNLLDMSQYRKFFGTMRVPTAGCDVLEFNPTAHHIVVAHRNHLLKIMEESKSPAEPVGILSSDHRDKWCEVFDALLKDPVNAESISILKRSLFLVCLDEPSLRKSNYSDRLNVAGHQCVHGGGSKLNSGNRWFDKTVQFMVGKGGLVGLCYEHSPSEGQPLAVMTDYLIKYIESGKRRRMNARGTLQNVEKLQFNISAEIRKAIKDASQKLDKLIADFELECGHFHKFGKEFVKSLKLSPDSFLQMAMQLAYYRLHKQPAPHYESATTRKYCRGRTETIRSCSVESIEFAKAMLDPKASENEKKNSLVKAIVEHKKYSIDANNGYGVDRHLLGLQLIALENNVDLPDFFHDKAYSKSRHFLITSSSVATKCAGYMVYGATAWDGYAICYNVRSYDIFYGVSAFHSNNVTNAKKMKEAFDASLLDMHDIVLKTT